MICLIYFFLSRSNQKPERNVISSLLSKKLASSRKKNKRKEEYVEEHWAQNFSVVYPFCSLVSIHPYVAEKHIVNTSVIKSPVFIHLLSISAALYPFSIKDADNY